MGGKSFSWIEPLILTLNWSILLVFVKIEEFGVISNTKLINTCSAIIKNHLNYAFPGIEFPYRYNQQTGSYSIIHFRFFDFYLSDYFISINLSYNKLLFFGYSLISDNSTVWLSIYLLDYSKYLTWAVNYLIIYLFEYLFLSIFIHFYPFLSIFIYFYLFLSIFIYFYIFLSIFI